MRPSWTGGPSSSRGTTTCPVLALPRRSQSLLTCSSGLVLASGYLSTAPPVDYSFAFDKPLHTVAALLLLTGLAVVAIEAWWSRGVQPQPPTRYIAIPLAHAQSRPPAEEIWTEAGQPGRRRAWTVRAVGILLGVLLFAICGRIGIFYRITKDIECSGPSTLVCTQPQNTTPPANSPSRSFLSCSRSTTASAIPASANTPPGVLTHARALLSTASTTSSSMAPPATSSPLFCSPSALSSSASSRAPSNQPTSAPLPTRRPPPSPHSSSLAFC